MAAVTLTGLLKDVAVKFPSRTAISVSGKFDLSHARLDRLVERAASSLVAAGVKAGDVVALTFPNTVEFIIMFLATIRVRATAAPLNAAYTAEEFVFYLSDSESKLLLTPKEGNEAAQAAASKLEIPHLTALLSDAESDIALDPIPSASDPNAVSEIVNDPSDVALFLHTSGTTSRPKGVPLTQFNLVSSVGNIISVYKLTESDSTVIVLPLFHVHGLIAGLLSSLGAGGSVTLPAAGRFSASTFWSDMKNYHATWYTAVPTIHQIILDRHLSKPEPVYPKLRFIRSCSAALAPSVLSRLEEAFGAPVLEAYAMTEATHLMASNPLPEDGPHLPGSVGRPIGQEMAILDENGVPQEANAHGEVCIRGPNVTKGYKNNPEANKSAYQFGWFHTGDLGYLDSTGYLHLVGRIKEMINRGGEKISPIEVDAVLISHPEIAQAVAFGVPDDKYGEEINCAIIPREGSNINEEEVSKFCKKNHVECAGMLERLMLAQAQECVFENTIAKGSTPGVCAKISRQVGIFYEEALSALNSAPLSQHFDKAWLTHVQIKAALFYAEACYRYSLELHEKEEIAEEIARLKCGISALSDTKKSSPKGAGQQLIDAANKLETNLNHNLERAVKENDRVYLMRVPPASSLTALPAFSMVKPMLMNEVLDASKEKMFSSLVPDSSAKALSRYTEMVDDVIRTQAEKLQQGSELARVRLKEMDLPDSILALEGNSTLPKVLKEDAEAVQICGGPAALEGDLEQLKDLRRVNQELLVQTEELLQKEAMEDAQFRSQFGTRWTRPQSSTLTKNLQERLNRFAGNLKQATESDARIERSVRDHAVLLSILDRRPIESALPTLARPMMSLDANEDAIVGALKQSLRQLESLGAQRAGLEDMLKEMKRKDDILPKLMTSTGSHEDLFRKEIGKYDHICQDIAQNIEAQEQLLMQIQAQNDEFASIFNLVDYKATCEKIYRQIEAAIAKYREIKDNVNEGLKFYVTLQDAITNVKQQCSDFVNTRNMQCREMIDEVQRKISGLSFQDSKPSGAYNYPSVGQLNSQPTGPANLSNPPPLTQSPVYQPPQQPTVPSYVHPPHPHPHPSHPPPPYATPQQPPPPYHLPAPSIPYPHPQYQQQPLPSHEYAQPAYPGWRAPYYNAPPQQPGSMPRPPYTVPPYPPNQNGYYRQ